MKLRIKEIREKHDLTVRDMAKKLGISKSYYSAFETEEDIINLKNLIKFCNLFHISVDYLLGLKDFNIFPNKPLILDNNLYRERIKNIRKTHNLTETEFSKIIKVSQPTLSSYETGRTTMPTESLYLLCKKLNISADYVLGFSNKINTFL